MQAQVLTPLEYIDSLPEDQRMAISELRQTMLNSLPEGFAETMSYGMISFVVPRSIYPAG